MSDEGLVEIPHTQLSAEALQGVLEEYCTRGGYDSEVPLGTRIAEIKRRLDAGRARIVYDPDEGLVNVVEKR